MRLPIRKPGVHTHDKPDPHMTEKKLADLKDKLVRLKKAQPRLAAEVKRLALMGDFSENAAYQIAKGRLRGLNQGIIETEELIKRAIIIESPKNNGTVQLGSFVTLEIAGRQKVYQILGSTETDPTRGIISHNSPLGVKLLGKRAGDVIQMPVNNKAIEYKILKIE